MYLISSGSWDDYNLTVQKMAVKIKGDADFFEKARYFSYLKKWIRGKVNERLIYWYWYAEAGSYGVLRLRQKHDSEHWCHCKRGCLFWQLLMQRCALPAVESGTFGIKNGVVGHGGRAADRFREGITRDFKDNRDVWKPTMKGIVEWIYEESEIMLHE